MSPTRKAAIAPLLFAFAGCGSESQPTLDLGNALAADAGAGVTAQSDAAPSAEAGVATCSPSTAITLADGISGPIALGPADAFAFSRNADSPGVLRVAKTGGSPTQLVVSNTAGALVADNDFVYWNTETNILRVAASGGPVVSLVSDPDHPLVIALDALSLYFADTRAIRSAPKSTAGAATTLVSTATNTIAVDDAFVYYNDLSGVSRVPKSGGPPRAVAAAVPNIAQIAVDDTRVFIVTGDRLLAAPKGGGGAATAFATAPAGSAFAGLVLDAANVYTTTVNQASEPIGSVLQIAKDGSRTVAIADTPARGLAVDDRLVYWTDLGEHLLARCKQ